MAGNVYSTYDLAKKKAHERMKELETDIFICRSKYQSGEEFALKTKKEVRECGTYLHIIKLPFGHHFKNKHNALREARRFEEELGKPVRIQKHTYEENGYTLFSHFTLCSI